MEDRRIVLVVDDQEDSLMYTSHVLRSRGYWVRTARTASECMQSIRTRRPDVILMDVNMPQQGGLIATGEVRRQSGLRHTPVVLYTSMPAERVRPLMAEVGASDFLDKGSDPDELLNLLEKWVERGATRPFGTPRSPAVS